MNTRSVLPISKPMPVTEPTVRKNRTYEWWRRTQTRRLGCGTLARTGHRLRNTAVRDRGTNVTLRSEEHTSELQSRFDLVCRLLLEKKKTHLTTLTHTARRNYG